MYIRTTKSYLKLRDQIQETFNFTYVACQSVPCLKLQMSLVDKGKLEKLPNPDYFQNPNSIDLIRNQVKNYKNELSKFILLSSFSYFEAYVVDVLNELIEFHGGSQKMQSNADTNALSVLKKQTGKFRKLKTILSKDKHPDRKRNATKQLFENGFIFPTSLLSSIGLKSLIYKIQNLKSVDIPIVLTDGFHIELNEEDLKSYDSIRKTRNKIAHGNKVSLSISAVTEKNNFLRNFSLKIDQHLLEHFFISEEFL